MGKAERCFHSTQSSKEGKGRKGSAFLNSIATPILATAALLPPKEHAPARASSSTPEGLCVRVICPQ